jgi:hypothetical protein
METQKGLVDNVFTGFMICFPAAFLVLLASTQNPLTASLVRHLAPHSCCGPYGELGLRYVIQHPIPVVICMVI